MTTTKTTEQIKEAIKATVGTMCEFYYNEVLRIKDEVRQYAVFMDKTSGMLNAISFQLGYLHIDDNYEFIHEMQNIRDEYLKNL